MSSYTIGVGKSVITYDEKGLAIQGFMHPLQKTNGYHVMDLYSRAFIIHDKNSEKYVVIVIADIWSCTKKIKQGVIKKLQEHFGTDTIYHQSNVQISGTHTHSGAGGYNSYNLYNRYVTRAMLRKVIRNLETIVNGIADSIIQADNNLRPGKVFMYNGSNNVLTNCGENRSIEAYNNNSDRNLYASPTDQEMLMIKFVAEDDTPIGMINWYPIHPTSMGQHSNVVSGDNKGYAAKGFEEIMKNKMAGQSNFVAAFANSNCGDVSGNIEFGAPLTPKTIKRADMPYLLRTEIQGGKQLSKALSMFNEPNDSFEELTGIVDFQYMLNDMSNYIIDENKRTWTPAVGLGAVAGHKKDGHNVFSYWGEGLVRNKLNIVQNFIRKVIRFVYHGKISAEEIQGHAEKPIAVFAKRKEKNILPHEVPLQILRIGKFISVAFPAELTTMAGRRLRNALKDAYGFRYIALSTYSNDYSQYVTTREEYAVQHYEGASTLYGPHTLEAYIKLFEELAGKLKPATSNS